MIADLIREDSDCRPAIEELLREIFPFTAAVLVPPDWDERYVTAFGFTLEEIYTYGAEALDARLRAGGLEPTTLRVGLPFDLPAQERARRGLAMLRAGYLGGPNGAVKASPEVTELMFDGLARQLDAERAGNLAIVWDFTDAEPWQLRVQNGVARVMTGRAEKPDLVFRCKLQDWTDVVAGRAEPWRLVLKGRIRPRGRLRTMLQLPRLLG